MASPMFHTIAALVLVSAALACGERSPLPLDPGGPSLATRDEHNNIREEFLLPDVDNPCTPAIEAIDLEGIIHVRYQGSSTGNGKGEFLGSETEDVVISTVITSQGGLPNFVSKIVLHHHKDGSITVDRSGEECRG